MRHDKRDDDGKYRDRSPAEERGERAKSLTQTHMGRFTHERDCDERRMSMAVTRTYAEWEGFKGQKVNRDGYHPKVTK